MLGVKVCSSKQVAVGTTTVCIVVVMSTTGGNKSTVFAREANSNLNVRL